MSRTLTAAELLWDKQLSAEKQRRRTEQRAWLKGVLLALALIVITVGLATILARMFGVSSR